MRSFTAWFWFVAIFAISIPLMAAEAVEAVPESGGALTAMLGGFGLSDSLVTLIVVLAGVAMNWVRVKYNDNALLTQFFLDAGAAVDITYLEKKKPERDKADAAGKPHKVNGKEALGFAFAALKSMKSSATAKILKEKGAEAGKKWITGQLHNIANRRKKKKK